MSSTPRSLILLLVLSMLVLANCGGSTPLAPSPSPTTSAIIPPPPSTATGVLVGAGDIGDCRNLAEAEATAKLLDRLPGTIFTTGDNAYMNGSRDQYRDCYTPNWGRHRSRTRPTPGNHEYETAGAGPYFEYFGANAGPSGMGYYSYTVGSWNVIALSSEIPSGYGSMQSAWLRRELSENRTPCTAVIWHRPLFSSGRHGDNPDMRDLWRQLHEFDVDLVINGHDHIYERFAPQDPNGQPDPARGIRQFIVGTGGAGLTEFTNVRPNSEVRAAAWGVAVFRLNGGGFQWEFVPVEGESFRDAGSAACH